MDRFLRWARTQFRVIGAIVRKDFTIFLRYPANAVMSLIEPIMWLMPVYFMGQGFSVDGKAVGFAALTGTSDYFTFVMVGALMSSYISAAFWGMGYSVQEDMTLGVLEPNWVSPASRVTLIIGRGMISLLFTTLNGIGVFLLGILVFRMDLASVTGNVFSAILTMLPMLVALTGMGLGISGLVLIIRRASTAIDISNYAIGQLSGGAFPVKVLPRPLLAFSLALPTTYAYDAVRGILLGTETMLPIRQEFAIMVVSAVLLCAAGYAVFKISERRCSQLGHIGAH